MKKVILVSPYFPPATVAGVHRVRHLAKHLPAHGWHPVVIRVDARHYTQPLDNALASLVPEQVEQVKTGAIPARVARMFGVGDVSLRAFWPIMRSTAAAIAYHRPAVIMVTGPPYYPLLMTKWLSTKHRLPVLVDLQDPWVWRDGFEDRVFSKRGIAHRIGRLLEPEVLRYARYVTSVSEVQNDELVERYPFLNPANMAAVPIGGDPEDFAVLRAAPQDLSAFLDRTKKNLTYVGTVTPRFMPVLRQFFTALRELRNASPELLANVRIIFIGTSAVPGGRAAETQIVAPIAEAYGVGDLVSEWSPRVPFATALALQANSDGLLILGSDEPHYNASKIYPILMSGTPYMAVVHARSGARATLEKAGGGLTLSFDDQSSLEGLTDTLVRGLMTLIGHAGKLGQADPAAYSEFTAHSVAGRFAHIFNEISKQRPQETNEAAGCAVSSGATHQLGSCPKTSVNVAQIGTNDAK